MIQGNFNLRQWLLDADTSGVDESLDEEGKRLFVLNDALANPDYGPVLTGLIVTAEHGCGLDALTELADCSEPRLAMMAIVNMLNVLANENLADMEFVIPDASSTPGSELSVSRDDLPSEELVRSKAAKSMLRMSKLFIERATADDFCPDFLTFLLTALMNISMHSEGKEPDQTQADVASIPTEQFLKAILRTWKTPELSNHRSETDNQGSFKLGFLITCYLKSLCITGGNASGHFAHESTPVDAVHPTGVPAIIKIGDWAVKFIIMRLYGPLVTAIERAQLFTVLHHCANQSEEFTKTMIRESVLTAIWRTSAVEDSNFPDSGTMSSAETTAYLKTTIPPVVLLNYVADYLLADIAVPGSGIWFENKQSRVTMWLARACMSIVKHGMRMVLLSDFPSSEEGCAQSAAVISLVSKLISHVWKAGVCVLFRNYNNAQGPLRQTCIHLFELLNTSVNTFCQQRNLVWDEVSRLNTMTTLQIGVNACNALKQNVDIWFRVRDGGSIEEIEFIECDNDELCEWCLSVSETPLLTCCECGKVAYCSHEHQRAHWNHGHKAECQLFGNCLEGSSFLCSRAGRLCGLRKGSTTGVNREAPFCGFAEEQSKELLVLGYRLPGVLVERHRRDGGLEVSYKTKVEALKEVSDYRLHTGAEDTTWETTIHNTLLVESLLRTSQSTVAMLYMRCDDEDDRRTFSLYCATQDFSQALSVRLLP